MVRLNFPVLPEKVFRLFHPNVHPLSSLSAKTLKERQRDRRIHFKPSSERSYDYMSESVNTFVRISTLVPIDIISLCVCVCVVGLFIYESIKRRWALVRCRLSLHTSSEGCLLANHKSPFKTKFLKLEAYDWFSGSERMRL